MCGSVDEGIIMDGNQYEKELSPSAFRLFTRWRLEKLEKSNVNVAL